jgi:hypothetical protein
MVRIVRICDLGKEHCRAKGFMLKCPHCKFFTAGMKTKRRAIEIWNEMSKEADK